MDAADALPPPTAGPSEVGRHPSARRAPFGTPGAAGRTLRTASWRGRDDILLVVPRPGAHPSPGEVASLVAAARERGIRRLLTGALAPAEQATFRDAGFAIHDRLHLLAHDLESVPTVAPPAGVKLRRARRGELGAVLAVDGRAFDGFWRLDRAGLDDAIHATASARVRVAADRHGAVVGYVVTGRSGDRGYVQRLAVDPSLRRAGIGAALVVDGLRWLRRRRSLSAVVNTQVANDGALALYRRLGFVLQPDGLTVLTLPLGDAGPTDAVGAGDPW